MFDIIHVGPAPQSPLAREYMVSMRDGVQLATDLYIPGYESPDSAHPRDTVLIRLPYDKSGDYTYISLIAEYFMAHDYVVVAQDVRGKFRSGGPALLAVNEVNDGYDTLEWIAGQTWSTGRVAMWGDSYYGFTQWAAAASEHPALKAISPRVTGTNLGEPVHRDALTSQRRVEWVITYLYPLTYFHSNDAYFWELNPHERPFSAQAERVMDQLGSRSLSYDQWYPHPKYLDRFPGGSVFSRRPIPTLHTIGWWDNCAFLSWQDVDEIAKHPGWATNHFLRIESMDHESFYLDDDASLLVEQQSDKQRRATLDRMVGPAVEFFDVFVRGHGESGSIPRVAWNLAGTAGMRVSQSWPPDGTREEILFAHPEGKLTPKRPATLTELTWMHDPANLVPTSVPNPFAYLMYRPNEAAITQRDDVLTFTGDAAGEDVALVGGVSVEVSVASDGPVMDVFVKLLDMAPDGTAIRIARGNLQVDHPSREVPVRIDLGQIGYVLRSGHALSLTIASSDFPEYIPQPGNGGEPWGESGLHVNSQRIWLGEPHSIRLTYNVLPHHGWNSDGDRL